MRPLCGIQHGGDRKSQGALARLCEFPGISPPKSPKNPITPIETSRDTLHPGTGVTTRTNRPAGRVRGLGLRVSKSMQRFRNQVTLRSLILVFGIASRWGRGYVGLPPKPAWGPVPRPHLRFAAVLSYDVTITPQLSHSKETIFPYGVRGDAPRKEFIHEKLTNCGN